MTRRVSLFLVFFLLAAPALYAQEGRIISAEGSEKPAPWTKKEKRSAIARRTLRKTSEASFHLIRLAGAEKPHYHKDHDLTASILRGSVQVHLAGKVFHAGPGDVIEIPRGMVHWVENSGSEPSVAYAVFTPPFDGKDEVPVRRAS